MEWQLAEVGNSKKEETLTFDIEPDRFLLETASGGRNLERLARVLAGVVLGHLFDHQSVRQHRVLSVRGW